MVAPTNQLYPDRQTSYTECSRDLLRQTVKRVDDDRTPTREGGRESCCQVRLQPPHPSHHNHHDHHPASFVPPPLTPPTHTHTPPLSHRHRNTRAQPRCVVSSPCGAGGGGGCGGSGDRFLGRRAGAGGVLLDDSNASPADKRKVGRRNVCGGRR